MADKRQKFSNFLIRGVFVYNPVLIQALGLCLVIAATTSLKVSLLLSGLISVTLIIAEVLTASFIKKLPNWVRVTVYMLIGLTVACPTMLFLESVNEELLTATGVYLPLISVNALVAVRCERYAAKHEIKESLFDGIASSIGFSVIMILTGIIREVIGNGTLWGKPIFQNAKMPGMLLPFGGLIVLGFMSAAVRSAIARIFPQNSKVIKNMDKPIIPEKPPETNTMSVSPVNIRKPIEGGKNNVTEVGVHNVNIIEKFVKNLKPQQDDGSEGSNVNPENTTENKKRRDRNRARKNRNKAVSGKPYTAPATVEKEAQNISDMLEEMDKEYNVTAGASSIEKEITPEEVRDIDASELDQKSVPNPDVDLSSIRIGSEGPKSSAEYMESFSRSEDREDKSGEESKPYNVDSQFEEIIKKYHLD
ncbi:MAG: hypothetical protein K5756_05260 [Clostridiales bacterium]|nr:hypothetical protein [Clostridiales bacterium]